MNKIEQDMEKIIVDDPISPSTRDLALHYNPEPTFKRRYTKETIHYF